MHGLPGESLAGALHLEKRLEKQNRKDATWKPAGCINKKSSIEKICAGADIEALQRTRETVPTDSNSSTTLKPTSQNRLERRSSLP
jgi:hypothetical protein